MNVIGPKPKRRPALITGAEAREANKPPESDYDPRQKFRRMKPQPIRGSMSPLIRSKMGLRRAQ